MPKNVIVGGGTAGIAAIETIRQFDSSSPITLVSDEAPYDRCGLPRFLRKEIGEAELLIGAGSEKYFSRRKVTQREGRLARISPKKKRIELEDGESIAYDNLLLATGSSPQRPPIAGASGKHVHTLWTLADAHALMASADMKRPSAVLVGADLSGLILLSTLRRLGWTLTLVENATQILPRMVDRRAAEVIEARLREGGIEVYTGAGVTSIAGGRRKTVALSDGRQLTSHVVVLSTGTHPNIGFLKGSGIKTDKGILVDARMRTNVAGVYAAGDVAQGPDLLGGPNAIHAVETTAIEHGRIAGANMAGQKHAYAGSLMTAVLEVDELHCASIGRWDEDADATMAWDPDTGIYRKLVWDGDRLVGGIIVGPTDAAARGDVDALRDLIRGRISLGARKVDVQTSPGDLGRLRGDTPSAPVARLQRTA